MRDEEIRDRYGSDVVISRKGQFALVHMDAPSDDTVLTRTREFEPDDYFDAGCPLCEIQRSQRLAIFDTCPSDDEEILID